MKINYLAAELTRYEIHLFSLLEAELRGIEPIEIKYVKKKFPISHRTILKTFSTIGKVIKKTGQLLSVFSNLIPILTKHVTCITFSLQLLPNIQNICSAHFVEHTLSTL